MDVRNATLSDSMAPSGRFGGRGLLSRQVAQSGDIALETVRLNPSQPSPGGRIRIEVDLRETAEFVTPFDPALCDPEGALNTTGLTAQVRVQPDWTSNIEESTCVAISQLGAGRTTLNFEVVAPQLPEGTSEAQHSVTVSVQQPGLDADSTTVGLTVTGGGIEEPTEPPGGGGGGGGGGSQLSNISNILQLVVILTVLGSVASTFR